ncbi:hypothetical protein ACHAPU_007866 [Fusarium lateritium]
MAFLAIGMQHTCIDRPGLLSRYFHVEDHADDADEIFDEEDPEKERHLDALVLEFKDLVLRGSETTDYETANGSSGGGKQHDDRSTVDYQRIVEFWNEIWPLRIQHINEELAAGWNPNLEALHDLGVSLRYETENEKEDHEEAGSEDEECYAGLDSEALEFAMFKKGLDMI